MNNVLDKEYLQFAKNISNVNGLLSGHLEWDCPSNIALIKYWGKKGYQQPLNPSLSITLQNSITRLSVDYEAVTRSRQVTLDFLFDDMPNPAFHERFQNYLQYVSRYLPFLNNLHLSVSARNTFPHSSGIASSASAFGSLALSLCSIEQMACGTLENKADFFRKASFLARLGSGSASRSVYGGYVLWGITKEIPGSSDEVALPVEQGVDNVFKDYCDSVLIIQKGEKEKSSTSGHALMEGHPFTAARVMQANYNLRDLLRSLHDGNTNNFTEILENEALSLHALMLSSSPGFFLFEARTLEVIKKIREYRRETGTEVGFTLDAGANVHLLYPTRAVKAVRGFINDVLLTYCEHGLVIHDSAGNGPVRMA